ncbi:MAG: AAA family ATPase, partial [Candidatus Dadabacteria bacterium]
MFSTSLSFTLEAAVREASYRKHRYFCVEHLLYALLFDHEVKEILINCGANIDNLLTDLKEYFNTELEKVDDDSQERPAPIQTPAVQRVLQHSIVHASSAGKDVITSKDVLVSLFSETDSHAVYFLSKQNITKLDVTEYISHGISKVQSEGEEEGELVEEFQEESREDIDLEGESLPNTDRALKVLLKYTEELTEKAKAGELDPVIGRDSEIERAIKILSRRQKNNPLFLGDPGVGKTAMAHGIAQRIADGDVPEPLKGVRLFCLEVGTLIAGTKFRGEFEERLRAIVKALNSMPGSILFIDEIHNIVGAGATGTGSMDAANLLKPALAGGKIRCIGSTTYEDYKKSFEKDRALSRRFSVIELLEPTVEETVEPEDVTDALTEMPE